MDESRALSLAAQALGDAGETPAAGRDVLLATGRSLHVDVGVVGHRWGIAYVTADDLAALHPAADLPPRALSGDVLPVVQGVGSDGGAIVLVLWADDYSYDDASGGGHEATSIAAERRIARDVRDFVSQAHAKALP